MLITIARETYVRIYDAISPVQQNIGKPIKLEAELLVPGNVRFEISVKRIVKTKDSVRYEYEVKEIK